MPRILLVEDDETLSQAIAALLQRAGHEVRQANDGREALKCFQGFQPDLVITDIIMPEVEGLETIRTLHRKAPTVKIVAISGGGVGGPEQYLGMAQKLGAIATLAKPFSTHDLLAIVTRILGGEPPPSPGGGEEPAGYAGATTHPSP